MPEKPILFFSMKFFEGGKRIFLREQFINASNCRDQFVLIVMVMVAVKNTAFRKGGSPMQQIGLEQNKVFNRKGNKLSHYANLK